MSQLKCHKLESEFFLKKHDNKQIIVIMHVIDIS